MTAGEIALRVMAAALGDKLLVWAGLASTVGAWFYAMHSPDVLRLIAASGLTVGTYLPLLYAAYRTKGQTNG